MAVAMKNDKLLKKGLSMGRRLTAHEKPLPSGLRGQFCKRFRRIVLREGVGVVADRAGLSEEFVRKLTAGERTPDLDSLPALAKALGLAHWTDWFDAKK
jgi:transcriptional regulator with XRE-family HTH domain